MKKIKPLTAILLIVLSLAAAAGGIFAITRLCAQPSMTGGGGQALELSAVGGFEIESPAPEDATGEGPSPAGQILSDEDGILITRVTGKTYKGYMAVIDDPTRVFVGTPDYFIEEVGGLTVPEMNEKYGSVLGINGGGYIDYDGNGSAGTPDGLIIQNGEIVWGYGAGEYDVLAFDGEGALYVGWTTAQELLDKGVEWAVSFGPALIIDGEIADLSQSEKNNINPRAAIGQRQDGKVVFLILEGRQVSTLGASLDTLAQLLYDAGCVNASNLDGGGSATMVYKGTTYNICGSVYGPRNCCTAFLVAPVGEEAAK